jgi:hypothetical protein
MIMALAIRNSSVTLLHELIIDGIYEEMEPGKSAPTTAIRSPEKTVSDRSDADIAVEEFLNLTRARYGIGPVASLFKAYLAVAAGC